MSDMLIVNPEAEPFWEGCREGRLRVQRCRSCDLVFFFPRVLCPNCSTGDPEWIDVSGRAKLYSYTIVWRKVIDDVGAPYVLALVDLEEGPRMMTHVVGCEPGDLRLDMELVVDFSAPVDGKPLPRFRPAA